MTAPTSSDDNDDEAPHAREDDAGADVDVLTRALGEKLSVTAPPPSVERVVQRNGIVRDTKTRELERCKSSSSSSKISPKVEARANSGPHVVKDEAERKEARATSPSELSTTRERPKTNASVARRMIGNALNMNLSKAPGRGGENDRKALAEERRKRAEERERQRERERAPS